jgi:hypothetical protein
MDGLWASLIVIGVAAALGPILVALGWVTIICLDRLWGSS